MIQWYIEDLLRLYSWYTGSLNLLIQITNLNYWFKLLIAGLVLVWVWVCLLTCSPSWPGCLVMCQWLSFRSTVEIIRVYSDSLWTILWHCIMTPVGLDNVSVRVKRGIVRKNEEGVGVMKRNWGPLGSSGSVEREYPDRFWFLTGSFPDLYPSGHNSGIPYGTVTRVLARAVVHVESGTKFRPGIVSGTKRCGVS